MNLPKFLYLSLLLSSAASPIYATVPTQNLTHDQQENTLLRCKSHDCLKELYAFPYFKMENSQIKLKEEKFLSLNEQKKLEEAKECIKKNEYKTGKTKLEKLAKNGSSEAMVELGVFYKEKYPLDAFNYFALAIKTEYLLHKSLTALWKKSLDEIKSITKNEKRGNIKLAMDFFINNEVTNLIKGDDNTALKCYITFFCKNVLNTNIPINNQDLIDQQVLALAKLLNEKLYIGHIGECYMLYKKNFPLASFYFRMVNTPESLYYIGELVKDLKINTDENGDDFQESERFNIAARIFIKAQTPKSHHSLSNMLLNNQIEIDENGNKVLQQDKDTVIARLFRNAYLNSGNKDHLCSYAAQIYKNKTNIDIDGKYIKNNSERCKIAAKYFILSKTPIAYHYLGQMIESEDYHTDIKGNPINKKTRYKAAAEYYIKSDSPLTSLKIGRLLYFGEINFNEQLKPVSLQSVAEEAARLFRKSKTKEALFFLAKLIDDNKISKDENGNDFTEQERHEVAARLYEDSETADGYNNLGILILTDKINTLRFKGENIFEKVSNLLKMAGNSVAYYHLALLELKKITMDSSFPETQKVLEKTKEYILKAIDLGKQDAVFFLEKIKSQIEYFEKLKNNTNNQIEQDKNIEPSDSDSSDSDVEDKLIQNDLSSTISKSSTQPADLYTEQKNSQITEFEDYLTPEYKEKRKKAKEIFSNLKSGKPLTLESLNPFNDNQQQKSLNTITWGKKALDQLSKSSSVNIKLINARVEYIKNNELSRAKFERLEGKEDLYSARITQKDRLVIKKTGFHQYKVMQCGGHYND